MSVIMVRDVSHVVIDVPLFAFKFGVSNCPKELVEFLFNFFRWGVVMISPHHHWDNTNSAVRNPAELVLEITL
jgi:hypothetical protein